MKEMLSVASSPHLRHIDTTRSIMGDVLIALSPAAVYGCILFGWRAMLVLLVSVLSCVASEYIWNLLLKKKNTIGDLSAVVTGLLLGMNLPSTVPLWVAAIGGVAAIIVVKQMFGGLGHNFVNPAMAARVILLVSFPNFMTSFVEPFSGIVASATPLAAEASALPSTKYLFLGLHSGCIGETSVFLLTVGGIYLMMRRVILPIIPVCFIGTVALATLIAGGDLSVQLFSGGLFLGAIFMATDYVTSPSTPLGSVIFGCGCGLLTFVIRHFGSLPEGVSYSIILMNILVPHIDRLTAIRPFGAKEVQKDE